MALAAALPAKLKTVVEALNLPIVKDAEGHRLMLLMSRPRKPRPAAHALRRMAKCRGRPW
jgi:hypothetical protein